MFQINLKSMLIALCDDLDISIDLRSYLVTRLDNEGIKFLTVTLPTLNALVLEGLNLGSISSLKHVYTAFRWKGNALVKFDKLLDRIFDHKTGALLANPDEVVLYQVRQLSLYFYKLAVEYDASKLIDAEKSFLETEKDLRSSAIDISFVDTMRKNLESTYVFPKDGPTVLQNSRPRCGPGTFSVSGRSKFDLPYYVYKDSNDFLNTALKSCEGISGFFKTKPSEPTIRIVANDTSTFSELLFVPKDSRGPRAITREPLYNLTAQMSFFDYFSRFFERHTNGRINFSDQQVNNKLAKQGSMDGSWATIDLKDASDRVSFKLVKELFKNIPALRYFLRFRTSNCKLPSREIIKLEKLAGMGSGLTFVCLALICHTAISTAISRQSGMSFKEASQLVYVYGDDIVVPTAYVATAKQSLALCLLRTNTKKSFDKIHLGNYRNYFRESCGGDYFKGYDVTPVKLKLASTLIKVEKVGANLVFPEFASGLNVLNAHAKELVHEGLLNLSKVFYKTIENVVGVLHQSNNYKCSHVVRYTRKYIDYATTKTGMYELLKAYTFSPCLEESSALISDRRYASSLKKIGSSDIWQHYHDLEAVGVDEGSIAIPRSVSTKRSKFSSIDLLA